MRPSSSVNKGGVLTEGCQLKVKIVPVELSLNGVTPQAQQVLLEFLIFLVLPVLINVLLIKVVLFWRNKRRLNLPVPQILPREIFQPGVILDLVGPVQAEAVRRLPLNHLVDEVCGLDGPALRDLVPLDLDLFGQNVISNLLPTLADIGSLTNKWC